MQIGPFGLRVLQFSTNVSYWILFDFLNCRSLCFGNSVICIKRVAMRALFTFRTRCLLGGPSAANAARSDRGRHTPLPYTRGNADQLPAITIGLTLCSRYLKTWVIYIMTEARSQSRSIPLPDKGSLWIAPTAPCRWIHKVFVSETANSH